MIANLYLWQWDVLVNGMDLFIVSLKTGCVAIDTGKFDLVQGNSLVEG